MNLKWLGGGSAMDLRLRVLNIWQFLVSHVLLIVGLILLSVGLASGNVSLNIVGIWLLALGLCMGFGYAFKKLVAK